MLASKYNKLEGCWVRVKVYWKVDAGNKYFGRNVGIVMTGDG